jgi:hypothetical protein
MWQEDWAPEEVAGQFPAVGAEMPTDLIERLRKIMDVRNVFAHYPIVLVFDPRPAKEEIYALLIRDDKPTAIDEGFRYQRLFSYLRPSGGSGRRVKTFHGCAVMSRRGDSEVMFGTRLGVGRFTFAHKNLKSMPGQVRSDHFEFAFQYAQQPHVLQRSQNCAFHRGFPQ